MRLNEKLAEQSDASSMQTDLNFRYTAWYCKLYSSRQYIDFIDLKIIFTVCFFNRLTISKKTLTTYKKTELVIQLGFK